MSSSAFNGCFVSQEDSASCTATDWNEVLSITDLDNPTSCGVTDGAKNPNGVRFHSLASRSAR